jgi:hypothetical protein
MWIPLGCREAFAACPTTVLAFALLTACGAGDGEDVCREDADCPDGLVCLLGEDSLDGACYPPACAEEWTGYGCDSADTG